MRKGFTRKIEPIRVLSSLQVEEIHKNTLEIMETTGVKYESKKALDLFKKSGCNVDHESRIVKFPPYLVEECIRMTPSTDRALTLASSSSAAVDSRRSACRQNW